MAPWTFNQDNSTFDEEISLTVTKKLLIGIGGSSPLPSSPVPSPEPSPPAEPPEPPPPPEVKTMSIENYVRAKNCTYKQLLTPKINEDKLEMVFNLKGIKLLNSHTVSND